MKRFNHLTFSLLAASLLALTTGCAGVRKGDSTKEVIKPTELRRATQWAVTPQGKVYKAVEVIEHQGASVRHDKSSGGALTLAADPEASALHASKTNQSKLGGAHQFDVGRIKVSTTNASEIIKSGGDAVGTAGNALIKGK